MNRLKKKVPHKLKQTIKNFLGINSFSESAQKLRTKINPLAKLEAKLSDLETKYKILENKYNNLEALFDYSVLKNIDIVSYFGDLYFWYTKDKSYDWIDLGGDTIKNYQLSERDFSSPEIITSDLNEEYESYNLHKPYLPEMELKNFLFLYLWLHQIDFTYCDIGANMGTTTIPCAKFFQRHQQDNKIVSFEPGIVYDLLKHSIKINGVSDLVTLENLAVGDRNSSVVIKSLLEHSESNSSIDFREFCPDLRLASCQLVESVRLDEYITQKQIKNSLVVKIDTEGNDWQVIQGMEKLIPRQVVIMIVEYTPALLRKYIEPEQVLYYLHEEYILLNMLTLTSCPHWKCSLIGDDIDAFKKFAQEVEGFSRGWTDVLALRRDLPNLDKLIRKLTNNGINNWFTQD